MQHSTQNFNVSTKCLLDEIPGAWGCKDENSAFLYVNAEFGNLLGLANPQDIIGKTDFDIPCDAAKCADTFVSQDKCVMQTAKRMKFLDIHPYANNRWRAFIFTKAPLRNENNQIIGTFLHGQEITSTVTPEIGSLLTKVWTEAIDNISTVQDRSVISTRYNGLKLTERQSQVLFFLLRGKTVKQIAYMLGLSERTVENFLAQLKDKFCAKNKYKLIQNAIEHGFLNFIPEHLFKAQLSVELN